MKTGRRPEAGVARAKPRTFRLTPRESEMLDTQATYRRFRSASDYIRWLIREDHEPSKQAKFERDSREV